MSTPTAAFRDEAFQRRLRWRARRGLLENDLILARFFGQGGAIDDETVSALDALLDLPDNQLLDLLLARTDLHGPLDRPDIRLLLARLRAA